jgi:bifunctional non-homologous end joining protein LigD
MPVWRRSPATNLLQPAYYRDEHPPDVKKDAPTRAGFIEPMLLLSSEDLPDGPGWIRELKLDGYRAIAFKTAGRIHLRSRNDKDFDGHYPQIVRALQSMPDETVIDGEIVAVDETGRPSFSALQNYGSVTTRLLYFVFDVMVCAGRDLRNETLDTRRVCLEEKILPMLSEPVRSSPELPGGISDLIQSVKAQGLEGLVAKRRDSRYEAGQRSGVWIKMRVNRGQEFVIGGYTLGGATFDALIFGYFDERGLIYAARTRNGLTPKSRTDLMRKLSSLETAKCPFANLPEAHSGRWGAGLTEAKMQDCKWVEPILVGQFEFVEWTPHNHLRHSRFVGMRDTPAQQVKRES